MYCSSGNQCILECETTVFPDYNGEMLQEIFAECGEIVFCRITPDQKERKNRNSKNEEARNSQKMITVTKGPKPRKLTIAFRNQESVEKARRKIRTCMALSIFKKAS